MEKFSSPVTMGVGAQNDLGGHQSFARKMSWKLLDKSIVFRFFCPNWGGLQKKKKKKVFTQIETVFLSKLWWSQKKKVFTHIETVFLSSAWNILLSKLAQTTWHCPKFWRKIAQKIRNRPKFWRKIAKIHEIAQNFDTLHQPTGGAVPPPAPHLLRLCQSPQVGKR